MLNERQNSTSTSASTSGGSSRSKLSAEGLKKRRDQNRISQRAFRLRKEKHAGDLEAKVEELKTLLETASYENTVAMSRMHKVEAELSYYRGMLFTVTSANNIRNPNSFLTSHPRSDYRPAAGGNRFAAGEGEMGGYDTVSCYGTHYKSAIASLATPVLADEYHRAGSYKSSSTDTYSPAMESPLESFSTLGEPSMAPQGQTLDSSSRASYLQFNTEELIAVAEDGLY